MQYNRHDLVTLTPAGRRAILTELHPPVPQKAFPGDMIDLLNMIAGTDGPPLPGIVRRPSEPLPAPDHVAVGFSSPFRVNDERYRLASTIAITHIKKLTTPFEVFPDFICETRDNPPAHRTSALRALHQIKQEFAAQSSTTEEAANRQIGVWGSAALEIFTGRPYTHDESDLDLILRDCSKDDIRSLMAGIDRIAGTFGIRVDVELLLKDGAAVNAREYLTETPTLLTKSLTGVELRERQEVEGMIVCECVSA